MATRTPAYPEANLPGHVNGPNLRTEIAARLMAGMLQSADRYHKQDYSPIAMAAVKAADALLEALSEEREELSS